MAITVQTSEDVYFGDGSTQSFLISFQFFNNDQIKVSSENTQTGNLTILTEGTDYTLTGGNPATNVLFTTAPTADEELRIYRQTPKTQPYDYINNGEFLAEDHEAALDRIIMLIQELNRDIATVVPVSSNAFVELSAQALLDAEIVSVNDNQRIIKRIKGSGGHTTADTTTPIDNGIAPWQELILVGNSDDETITIPNSGNVRLKGDKLLTLSSTLRLIWDDINQVWIE